MRNYRRLTPSLLLTAALVSGGCVKTVENRGHVMEFLHTEALEKGVSTMEDVSRVLGSPSSKSDFGQETWYYIGMKVEKAPFRTAKIIKQDVVEITFNSAGIMEDLRQYDGNDAKKIAFAKDATPTSGNKVTLAEQLLGNLGRFNPKETEPQ